jgi:hypothetical protein
MTTVDPYVVRLPEVMVNQDGSPSEQMRAWLEYDNRWKHDLWQLVTGGSGEDRTAGIDIASANENTISVILGLLDSYLEKTQDLESEVPIYPQALDFRAISKSANYTALDYDFVSASSASTITLPQNPVENSVVIVRNADGTLIGIGGNGKNINGSASITVGLKGNSLLMQYFLESDEWFIR